MVKEVVVGIVGLLATILLGIIFTLALQGCFQKAREPGPFSTPPGQWPFPEKRPAESDSVLLDDGQSLELLEDAMVYGRIPYSGDELYTGDVRIKKGSMIVKPKVEGPIHSTPLPEPPPQIVPMTREEKLKRFQVAENLEEK